MPWTLLGPILLALSSLSVCTLQTQLFPRTTLFSIIIGGPAVDSRDVANILQSAKKTEARREVVQSIIVQKTQATRCSELKVLIRHARRCHASDKRDLVYAFLAVADPGHAIVPDYGPSNTIAKTFTDAAERIVLRDNNLDILFDAVGTRGAAAIDLPSWVPDWSCKDTPTTPKVDSSRPKPKPLSLFKDDGMVSVSRGVLKARGILLGRLEELVQDSYGTRKDFKMTGGDDCHTNSLSHVGDQIWSLQGSPSTFVMREINGLYVVVGEAMCTFGKVRPSQGIFMQAVDVTII